MKKCVDECVQSCQRAYGRSQGDGEDADGEVLWNGKQEVPTMTISALEIYPLTANNKYETHG